MKNKESALLIAFRKQIQKWLAERPRRIFPNNTWIEAKEGRIYIRFVFEKDRIDLAHFLIESKYWGKGIARSIIHEAISQDVQCVKIESIAKDGWFEKISQYRFKGFCTKIIDQNGDGMVFDIEFVRSPKSKTRKKVV